MLVHSGQWTTSDPPGWLLTPSSMTRRFIRRWDERSDLSTRWGQFYCFAGRVSYVFIKMNLRVNFFNKMGTFLVEVFKQYNWRRVVVLSSNYFVWLEASVAIRQVHIFISFSYFLICTDCEFVTAGFKIRKKMRIFRCFKNRKNSFSSLYCLLSILPFLSRSAVFGRN